jgi:hypothetical protein
MLGAVVARIGQLLMEGKADATGLSTRNPIVRFLQESSLRNYLALDDFVVWASLQEGAVADDPIVAELSSRLLNRRLYKAIDVSAALNNRGGEASVARFRAELVGLKKALKNPIDILEDHVSRNPYKRRGFESPDALSKVLIRRTDGKGYEDLADRSDVVKALQPQSLFRVYVRNDDARKQVDELLKGIVL